MTTTQPLSATVISVGPQRITFRMNAPAADLWLGKLNVTPQPQDAGGALGLVTPGNQGASATHTLSLGATKFAFYQQFVTVGMNVDLEITYDPSDWVAYDCFPLNVPLARSVVIAEEIVAEVSAPS
jgi:hypothetical protein